MKKEKAIIITLFMTFLSCSTVNPQSVSILNDPVNLVSYRNNKGTTYSIKVTGTDQGSVWGGSNGIYTDNSQLGKAAVHAGLLKIGEVGVVKVTILSGQPSYTGSTKNGISTADFGSFSGSFSIANIDVLETNQSSLQPQTYGLYQFYLLPGWTLDNANTNQNLLTFRYMVDGKSIYDIRIKQQPVECPSIQEFNKLTRQIFQDYYVKRDYVDQWKVKSDYSALGKENCHLMSYLSKSSNQRGFILSPYAEGKMYNIYIVDKVDRKKEIRKEALEFIAGITLSKNPQPIVALNNSSSQPTKKANTNQNPTQPNVETSKSEIKNKNEVEAKSETKNPVMVPKPTMPVPDVKIEKGIIPDVKFSATNPCAAAKTNENGLPWESSKPTGKIELPEGVDAAIPPIIPALKSLSQVSYNAAVSTAFEGMRLVYGPMPEEEAKKFEAAWAPLFDFQTQEIIDYLNKMNPLISQFLASREAYTRTLNDIQMVWLDAGMAIEMNEQQAWESAMAEAGMYASALPPLEAAMKTIAKEIELLGNPPSPVDAKCEARSRYKKMLPTTDPAGCWAGFRDDLFISSQKLGIVYEPKFVYIFKVNVNGAEKYFSIEVCIDCNLGMTNQRGNCTAGDYGDSFVRDNLLNTENYTGKWIDGPRQGQMSQNIQKFIYPDIPEFAETTNERLLGIIAKDKALDGNLAVWEPSIRKMIQSKTIAHSFYKTALEWTQENLWQDFDYSEGWRCPDDVVVAFANAMGGAIAVKAEKKQGADKTILPAAEPTKNQPEIDKAEKDRIDAIEFHTEMTKVIQHNLDRDVAERKEVIKSLSNSKDKKEAEEHARRLKELNLRIIGLQSNIQAEQDLVTSHQTGQLVHTRTVFDEYARNKFIDDIRENAARVDATRRIAERIDRQIELLPWELQAEARERARTVLDGKTIASGDLEKAKRLVNAINEQVQGYAEYDYAQAKEAEVDAQQNEFYAQTTIMAAGAGFIGFGSAALIQAYGAEAAIAVYGPQILGSIWGGTTGMIAGGPKEGLVQAISWTSPKGFAAMQFLEGYETAGYEKNAATSTKIWEGVKQAGTAYFIGKVFEFGVGLVIKGSLIAFGKDNLLFKPIVLPPSQRSSQVLDAMRTTQKLSEAQDAMKAFQNLEIDLAMLKRNPAANSQKIAQLEAELQQLSASLNADYFAKWLFKYKASPGLRRQFDLRVQKNYSEMTPGMIKRLEQQGYNMDGIEFRQFRNATSGGSSSMDLDLGPVMKGTMNEPGIKMFKNKMIVKKDGSVTTLEQFMKDSKAAMNAEYRKMTGISAPSSDMNLVTSVHPEAFSTPKLLDHKIDFSTFTADEVASIGKVLNVKMEGINKNQMMTNTMKMQAKCRESSKEIENMLLRKLKEDIKKAPAGSPQQKQIQADINYWEDMLKRFKQIGTDETNPMKIIEMNREIMKETGGKDVTGVINDLKAAFSKK